MESKPCRVLFQALTVFPRDVFGPVDFFALLRFAAIFRGEDPFVGIAEVGVSSVVAVAGMSDSAGFDPVTESPDSNSGGNPISG